MTDEPGNLDVAEAMAAANAAISEDARVRRMIEAFQLSAAIASHVRMSYHALCGPSENGWEPLPAGEVSWHLARAAWRAEVAWHGGNT